MITLTEHSHTKSGISKNGKPYSISYWFGVCGLCNQTKLFTKSNIDSHRQKSCGCWRRQKGPAKVGVESIKLQWFNGIISNSKKRGRPVEISFEEAVKIAEQNCEYCGDEPKTLSHNSRSRKLGYGPWKRNGVDRIDSSKGYIQGNVCPCCPTCNLMKNDFDRDIFISQMNKIHNKQILS